MNLFFPWAVFVCCAASAFVEAHKVWETPALHREYTDAWPIAWRIGLAVWAVWAACVVLAR